MKYFEIKKIYNKIYYQLLHCSKKSVSDYWLLSNTFFSCTNGLFFIIYPFSLYNIHRIVRNIKSTIFIKRLEQMTLFIRSGIWLWYFFIVYKILFPIETFKQREHFCDKNIQVFLYFERPFFLIIINQICLLLCILHINY